MCLSTLPVREVSPGGDGQERSVPLRPPERVLSAIQQNRDPIGYTKRTRRYPPIKKIDSSEECSPKPSQHVSNLLQADNNPPRYKLTRKRSKRTTSSTTWPQWKARRTSCACRLTPPRGPSWRPSVPTVSWSTSPLCGPSSLR